MVCMSLLSLACRSASVIELKVCGEENGVKKWWEVVEEENGSGGWWVAGRGG